MKFYHQKYRSKKPLRRTSRIRKHLILLTLLLILLLLATAFLTGPKSLFKLYSLHQTRQALLQEKERLQKENQALKEEIQKLKQDPREIERVAREKYNLKKKNEDVYIIDPE